MLPLPAVTGVLKGYDPLLNLVLDETKEWLRDPFDPYTITGAQHTQHPPTLAQQPSAAVSSLASRPLSLLSAVLR